MSGIWRICFEVKSVVTFACCVWPAPLSMPSSPPSSFLFPSFQVEIGNLSLHGRHLAAGMNQSGMRGGRAFPDCKSFY